ncbi:galactose mutarotase-like protein [Coccomyxa subellipsoidea C-169]|uniref:glucose-6-phosphate 1-epimerase n=1 Tax=Coccomyxa subellipsoidea (strain C-169) TaxID=574566 RepID=I0Z4V2_COCSC|nr:galactose mutarotase-like protein [Coccomyxa subellipsoidea C-169]EIE25671.1 galactose mutarotase-like protein [Coccomyxa subellipsoidea C-169]|eukprot:XP_005650215.1 galactose mutarotase-like protein [Coccomyxa subellipsoidea C-169]
MAGLTTDQSSGQKYVVLKSAEGTTAEIFLHGAHVTSWKTVSGEEVLFVSKQAVYKPPKAIRGGIPVCFPQFGGFGPLSQHGFARNSEFAVTDSAADSVTLSLTPSKDQLQLFPHPFELKVKVDVGNDVLEQTLTATNTGSKAFELTAALHTYFSISSIDKARVDGLSGVDYLDSLQDKRRLTENGASVRFGGEVDRIYLATPSRLEVVDEGRGRAVVVEKQGFPDAVVWNPWVDKAAGMGDFGDDEYKEMVCLEPAVAGSGPVTLQPGATWTAKQTLSLRQL